MTGVLGALVPVFLIIALGQILKRSLLPEDSHWVALERLTYFILFPALLIVSISRAELGNVKVLQVSVSLLGAIALFSALLVVMREPICRGLRLMGPGYTSVVQGSLRWNSYIALAVSGSLAGTAGLAVAAVGLAVMIPTLNTISVAVLARHGEGAAGGNRAMLIQIMRNPFIWSCALGGLINLLHIHVPAVIFDFGDILGRASLALGLLVVGAGLRLADLRRPRGATWLTSAVKLIGVPLVAILIGSMLGLTDVDLLIVAVASSVPSAPNGYVLARQMGGDAPLLAQMLTVQTVLAAATMPAIIAAVSHLGG
ncbi:AEC family transporter [Ancylobacter mangrovi]|uniref:AEC family transporter n=1 Tax=Ancylobacter mangrovi TaxID=2972472 RepID=UPI00216333FE|nr:AEC family transporter [Ancylobacter mangrovi]MCS0505273.1 AEC family transporter [Ancylobacter mangrovi]